MSQPVWKTLWSTDCTLLMVDETGVYPPELEVAEEVSGNGDRDAEGLFELYSVPLDPCVLTDDGFLNDAPGALEYHRAWFEDDAHDFAGEGHLDDRYCPQCKRWVSHKLTSAARSAGMDPAELREKFLSEDPSERAWAYETIAGYHGWNNFDSYPLTLTEAELEERWNK